jgi:hypothetical protein
LGGIQKVGVEGVVESRSRVESYTATLIHSNPILGSVEAGQRAFVIES